MLLLLFLPVLLQPVALNSNLRLQRLLQKKKASQSRKKRDDSSQKKKKLLLEKPFAIFLFFSKIEGERTIKYEKKGF